MSSIVTTIARAGDKALGPAHKLYNWLIKGAPLKDREENPDLSEFAINECFEEAGIDLDKTRRRGPLETYRDLAVLMERHVPEYWFAKVLSFYRKILISSIRERLQSLSSPDGRISLESLEKAVEARLQDGLERLKTDPMMQALLRTYRDRFNTTVDLDRFIADQETGLSAVDAGDRGQEAGLIRRDDGSLGLESPIYRPSQMAFLDIPDHTKGPIDREIDALFADCAKLEGQFARACTAAEYNALEAQAKAIGDKMANPVHDGTEDAERMFFRTLAIKTELLERMEMGARGHRPGAFVMAYLVMSRCLPYTYDESTVNKNAPSSLRSFAEENMEISEQSGIVHMSWQGTTARRAIAESLENNFVIPRLRADFWAYRQEGDEYKKQTPYRNIFTSSHALGDISEARMADVRYHYANSLWLQEYSWATHREPPERSDQENGLTDDVRASSARTAIMMSRFQEDPQKMIDWAGADEDNSGTGSTAIALQYLISTEQHMAVTRHVMEGMGVTFKSLGQKWNERIEAFKSWDRHTSPPHLEDPMAALREMQDYCRARLAEEENAKKAPSPAAHAKARSEKTAARA